MKNQLRTQNKAKILKKKKTKQKKERSGQERTGKEPQSSSCHPPSSRCSGPVISASLHSSLCLVFAEQRAGEK